MNPVSEQHSTTFNYSRKQITEEIRDELAEKGYTNIIMTWDKAGKNLSVTADNPGRIRKPSPTWNQPDNLVRIRKPKAEKVSEESADKNGK